MLRKVVVVCVFLVSLFFEKLSSQGTPHIVYGVVRLWNGEYPDSSCFTFDCWISSRPDERISLGELGTAYLDSVWSTDLSRFPTEPSTGETLFVSLRDFCENARDTIIFVIDMSVAYQNVGTAILRQVPPPSITLISPNGGEILWDICTISWTTTGSISYVSIFYSLDNGFNWNDIILHAPNTGSFIWDIPETTS
ncbi:MAG: hypothetical protein ACPL6C_01480, partial [bacterium]